MIFLYSHEKLHFIKLLLFIGFLVSKRTPTYALRSLISCFILCTGPRPVVLALAFELLDAEAGGIPKHTFVEVFFVFAGMFVNFKLHEDREKPRLIKSFSFGFLTSKIIPIPFMFFDCPINFLILCTLTSCLVSHLVSLVSSKVYVFETFAVELVNPMVAIDSIAWLG